MCYLYFNIKNAKIRLSQESSIEKSLINTITFYNDAFFDILLLGIRKKFGQVPKSD